ncbi:MULTISPECIES: LuxR C-terminal-related transcriptional regulator [Corynebacterium]|mgnify:FL=1|uniref:Response regulator transcription factor n=1 Tax=Corynebacterium amycolatum TaxID=43765 RepID=A0AB38XUL1_CORAY|nr:MULTISPECIES: response regulator transcription factor [Corynebacterium]AIN83084.1 bacterial regulatory s, luxR family protein [Corynebacterium sp. ATCC 6931]KAA9244332.1 response regulator transcription factor [Corynebacterium amycolatum]KAA9268819.1 response regulator transcription factor [Corynebacterium amycolatum]KAA9289928.1 response regulator transcription factor [Corynebacterium amycolatum]MBC6725283.1 DNA-binding response regulator [Corynebacterium amycolatum]
MKIVIADDSALLREGVAGLVEKRGHEVIAMVDTAHGLVADIDDRFDDTGELPDLVITDVRMPPKMSDDGLRAAVELRERYPQLNVMVLSQYVAPAYARELFSPGGAGGSAGVGTGVGSSGSSSSGGTGYLLKDRVGQVLDFLGSLEVVAGGGVVIDPDVATALMQSGKSGLASLTAREREVLELMARGKSNKQIADDLVLSGAAVAKHVSNIFMKLHLEPGEENRRVRAILEFLTATSGQI